MAEKTLVIKIKTTSENAGVIEQYVRALGGVVIAENRVQREMHETAGAARMQSAALSAATTQLRSWVIGIAGAIGAGRLFREVFNYNQDFESTANSIAGLYLANKRYTDSTGAAVDQTRAWAAAQAEAQATMARLQQESLKTAATVPQIGDAFATTYGAIAAAGIRATDENVLRLTVRLTQAANAFKVPMDQINQEVSSLVTAQITEDSKIAKRLGLDNASVKAMQANGTFIEEIIRRTESYSLAAEAQSNTIRGKAINAAEATVATLSRAFDPLLQKTKGALDGISGFVNQYGDRIVTFFGRVIAAGEQLYGRVSAWVRENRALVNDIGAVAAAAVVAVGVVAVAINVATAPITLTIAAAIAAVIGLTIAWRKLSELSEIKVAGKPIASYLRATFDLVLQHIETHYRLQWAALAALIETIRSGVRVVVAGVQAVSALQRMIAAHVEAVVKVITAPFRLLANLTISAVHVVRGAREQIVSEFGSLPKGLTAPITGIARMITHVRSIFGSIVDSAAFVVRATLRVFGGLADKITEPFVRIAQRVFEIMSRVPDQVLSRIPGGMETKAAVTELLVSIKDLATAPGRILGKELRSMTDDVIANNARVRAAFANEAPIAGPGEVISGLWQEAIERVDGLLPEATVVGQRISDALSGITSSTNAPAKKADPKVAERVQRTIAEYTAFISKYKHAAEAAGDPFSQALAKIETDREAAVRKLEELQKELKGALNIDFGAARNAINKFYDAEAVDAARDLTKQVNDETRRGAEQRNQILANLAAEGQQLATERRLALIDDEIQRELEMQRAANQRWLEEERAKIVASIPFVSMRITAIEAIEKEKRQRDNAADEEAQRKIRERTLGTAEYWKRLYSVMKNQFAGIAQIVADSILEVRNILARELNGFLDDFIDGQVSITDALGNLSKGLAKVWTKNLTDILLNGKNVVAQLKDLFKSIYVPKTNAQGQVVGADYLGTFGAGAGFGGMVGSLFQTPNNYAGTGGAIGGGIGAAIGAYFGGPAGAQVGAIIGSAIGSAIGSMIQKGKDFLRVRIKDGIVTLEEKGISREAAVEVENQIRRRVKQEAKGWQSILDKFPESVQRELAKLPPPKINMYGAVEESDISDSGAMNALGDILGNKLPKAGFEAYRAAIERALSLSGVGRDRLEALFSHWGTLQGKELQDAVRTYVETMIEATDLRDKFKAPFKDRFDESLRRHNATPLTQIDDLDAKIQAAVASMAKLTDIDDLVAAQQHINQLASQRYEMEMQYLQRIHQIAQTLSESIGNQKEQLQVAGMGDQEKIDFFFGKMSSLRAQLETATDPEQISRLTQQIQQYVSQASGVASDNPELRAKLIGILDDVDRLSQGRLADAISAVGDRDKKPADALTTAAELLMKAAGDLSGVTKPPPSTEPPPEGGGRPVDGGDGRKGLPVLEVLDPENPGVNLPRPPRTPSTPPPLTDPVIPGSHEALLRFASSTGLDDRLSAIIGALVPGLDESNAEAPNAVKAAAEEVGKAVGEALRGSDSGLDERLSAIIGALVLKPGLNESNAEALNGDAAARRRLQQLDEERLLVSPSGAPDFTLFANIAKISMDEMQRRREQMDVTLRDLAAIAQSPRIAGEHPKASADEIGKAVGDALQGSQFSLDMPIEIPNMFGEREMRSVVARVRWDLKNNPNATTPRT